MSNYPNQYINPIDFYNYLDYLNLGGLVKANQGMDLNQYQDPLDLIDDTDVNFLNNPHLVQRYTSGTEGYDLELDGEEFDPYAEGEFTTSKIERDRNKTNRFFDKQQDYLFNEDGTYKEEFDPKKNPLRKKKWTLHNTSDETMYYDKFNPTKLMNKDEYEDYWNKIKSDHVIANLNARHEANPEKFQKVTGFDATTREITYAGDKLEGDIFSDENPGVSYIGYNKDDNTFSGSLISDKEGNIETKDREGTSRKFSYSPAQIGFEIEKPLSTPASQMDVPKPINTISQAPEGKEIDWQSVYEKRGDMYKDMNLEDYITEAKRQKRLHDQHGQWDYRSADEYAKHKQLQDLLGVSSQEVWDERYKPEGERKYDSLSGFEKKYVRNKLGVTEDELMSYYTHPDLSQRAAPSSDINEIAEAKKKMAERERELGIKPGDPGSAGYTSPAPMMTQEELDFQAGIDAFAAESGITSEEALKLYEVQEQPESKQKVNYGWGEGPNSWGYLGDMFYDSVLAPVSHALDVISVPKNLIVEGIEGLAGTGDGEFNWKGVVPRMSGDFSFDTLGGDAKYVSDVVGMENSHWLPKLAVDLVTDPMTYVGAGLVKGAAQKAIPLVSKVAPSATKLTPYVDKIPSLMPSWSQIKKGTPYAMGASGVAGALNIDDIDPTAYSQLNKDADLIYAKMDDYYNQQQMAEGGSPAYRLDEDGNYIPQTTMTEDISEDSELCSCDANIPASDTVKCQEACENQVTEVDEVREEKEKGDGRGFEKAYEAVMQGMGLFNQISEATDKPDMVARGLAQNQFQTDSRSSRGDTDINTGYQFQDKRVKARQGSHGTEMIDLNLPQYAPYTGPKYNLGMFMNEQAIDPYVDMKMKGMSLSRNFPIGDSNISLTPRIGFTDQRFTSDDLPPEILSQYFPEPSVNPNFGLGVKYNFDEGGRTEQLRMRDYDDVDTTIELEEDEIERLMALGAEIDYI